MDLRFQWSNNKMPWDVMTVTHSPRSDIFRAAFATEKYLDLWKIFFSHIFLIAYLTWYPCDDWEDLTHLRSLLCLLAPVLGCKVCGGDVLVLARAEVPLPGVPPVGHHRAVVVADVLHPGFIFSRNSQLKCYCKNSHFLAKFSKFPLVIVEFRKLLLPSPSVIERDKSSPACTTSPSWLM